MSDLVFRTLDGGSTTLSDDRLDAFREGLRGDALTAGSAAYDEARSIWNGMIDRRPALIVRCAGAADVRRSVELARDHGLLTAVRGGGHNIAGNAVCDGGLMIDLSRMSGVRVDPEARTARVGPGATLADFDHEAQAFGLATPLGINSTTGVAGLTLGGGFGWLTRKHGMTVDNLLSADVVTADGALRRASEDDDPDLFWAIRGGGGNFGVVTSFEFDLHEVGPAVLQGLIVYPFDDARRVLEQYGEFTRGEAPEELSVWFVTRKAPPLPFLPEEVHGKEVAILALVHAGDPDDGAPHVETLSSFAEPIGRHVGPGPYAAFQKAFDPLLTPGARNYWKSHDFTELGDGAIDTILEFAGRLPSPQCEIFVAHLGGAMTRVAPDATAYPHRATEYVMNVHGRWEDPAMDDECVGWAREFSDTMAPHAAGSVYVNFLTEDEADRVESAYRGNIERLREVKRQYDPENLFRLNQNIRPA